MKQFYTCGILFSILLAGCTMAQRTTSNPQDKAIVYTSFVVDTLGNVTNVKVLKVDCVACPDSSVSKMINEAQEAVSNQPKWKVARDSDGNKISVQFNLPVTFDKTKY